MPTTPQSIAINGANETAQNVQRIWDSYKRLADIKARSQAQDWAAIWDQLPTATLNADGSLGGADSPRVDGHPIDTRVVPGLNLTLTAAQFAAGLSLIDSFAAIANNSDSIAATMPFLGSGN